MPGQLIPPSVSAPAQTVDLTPVTTRLQVVEEAFDDLDPRVTTVEQALPQKASASTVAGLVTQVSGLGSKFRGDWSPDELIYAQNFDAGATPTGWSHSGASPATVGTPANGGTAAPYANALTHPWGGNSQTSVRLDLNALPELVGKTLTRMTWWVAMKGNGSLALTDGGNPRPGPTIADAGWQKLTASLSSINNDLLWSANRGSSSSNAFYITGVGIYGTSSPYQLGEFVLYAGKMWKSAANNNGTTPGASVTWEEVPVNYNQTYTTAGRPSATTSGKGATIYDGDLNLPLYSNGTAWTDAMGTVR